MMMMVAVVMVGSTVDRLSLPFVSDFSASAPSFYLTRHYSSMRTKVQICLDTHCENKHYRVQIKRRQDDYNENCYYYNEHNDCGSENGNDGDDDDDDDDDDDSGGSGGGA
ncbi:hypothetical protein PoB_005812200 [Plakobranchus ocellatus]|uniref:Uncharacterized protein n=1 Tax=Plakobranchus ocellatus TaxID=259542 RepID=A0AAV4CIX5_9GAST|nr:hypothetical protein PoB_005812200 [Plakobranchus ocellatus]